MGLAWILFLSGAELEKFRFDPNPIPLGWVKFDVLVFVKPFNGIDPAYHAFEEVFGAQLVLHARRIGYGPHANNFNFVSDRKFPAVSGFGFSR